MTAGRRAVLSAIVLAGVAIVLWGGYGGHWHWTGIDGHTATLWDWMQLLLLPMAVAVVPIWMSREATLEHRVKLLALGVVLAFVPVVLAGYLVPWHWTGFTGNKLWNWLHLLLLPLLLPAAIVPALRPMAQARMVPVTPPDPADAPGPSDPVDPVDPVDPGAR